MSQPTLVHRYRYDPLDRLIETAGIQRFYNKTRMATEIQGAVQHSVFQSGDVLLAQTRREGAQVNCTLLATDFQRSVLHGVSPDKVEPNAYNVYGHRPAHSGLLSVLGFNGERPDPITGHYLLGNGYRAFNPVLMRFNSPDSWSPFGEGGVNCYGYCGGEPVNSSDPTGHALFSFLKGVLYDALPKDKILGLKELHAGPKVQAGERTFTSTFFSMQKIMPDVYIGFDNVQGRGKRLNIQAHGGYHPSEGGLIMSKGLLVTPSELYGVMKSRKLERFQEIRMIVCYSANGDVKAFAKQMADLSGVNVKGYIDNVYSRSGPREIAMAFKAQRARGGSLDDSVIVIRQDVLAKGKNIITTDGQERVGTHRSKMFRPS